MSLVAVALVALATGCTQPLEAPRDAAFAMAASPGRAQWRYAGQNLSATRNAATESRIGTATVGALAVRWATALGGAVAATPAVDGTAVYLPDGSGNLTKLDRKTGAVQWVTHLGALLGSDAFATATPAVADGVLYLGTRQAATGSGAHLLAIDAGTGAVLWITVVDADPTAVITQSAAVFDGTAYVGVASIEGALAAAPGYPCCSFRGSVVAVDATTGQILWKTYTAPEGYAGNAVSGGMPVVDARRAAVYVTTGATTAAPGDVLACVAAANGDPSAVAACTAPDSLFDAFVALDRSTGAVRWATRTVPYDVWNDACLVPGDAACPDPPGADAGFAQGPALVRVQDGRGQPRDLLGAGTKAGTYWMIDPDTGAVVWVTQAGPAGQGGGLVGAAALDGARVYLANANGAGASWTLPDGVTTTAGIWSALDAATGEILWQTADPTGSPTPGAVTVANGVVYACSTDANGTLHALASVTGAELWSYASGAACEAGAAISNGTVYWGSGGAGAPGGSPRITAFGVIP